MSNNESTPQDNRLKIEISPETAEGIYANLAIITHSSAEFLLDFVRMLPGAPNAQVKSRIILAPEHAKRLLLALHADIAHYERQFGEIKMPGNTRDTTANPFNIKVGDA